MVLTQGELFVDPGTELVRGATFSADGQYRYRLWRTWMPARPQMVWLMLNPSTADAEVDDPTIRRCKAFARREGCGGVEILNLYGLRATQPRRLLEHPDPEGPDNAAAWGAVLDGHVGPVVAAWGAFPGAHGHLPMSSCTRYLARQGVLCLGHTAGGHPRHPLYVPAVEELRPW